MVHEPKAPNVVPLRASVENPPDYKEQTDELQRQLLTQLPNVLRYLFPNGIIRQGKFFVGNVRGDKGNSLTVQLNGDKTGLWHDFESGEGGNLFQLWGAVRGFDPRTQFPTLIEDVRNWLVAPPPERPRRSKGTRPGSTPPDLGPPTGKWDYTDVDGNLLATVYRFDPPGKKKEYRPWDAVRGCMKAPEPRPLYNQPGIAKSETVVLVEGEKCAEALMGQGIPATTAMSGANTAVEKTDWSPLAGKRVIIWPDNDAAGQKYAINCASAVAKAGAAGVVILQPPEGRPEKWDAADAVEEGLDIRDFLKNSPITEIKEVPKVTLQVPAFTFGQLYADRAPMPADIISPRVLTPGGLLVFAGAPKVGKSDFLMTLLAHMAAGAPFLCLQPERPLRVFYLQAEIQYHYLRERLQSLQIGESVRPELETNLVITPQICMKLDEAGLQQTVTAIQHHFPNEPPDIIAIDPIRNLFDGGPNGDSENDNNAMLFFLQERVEALRRAINPQAGIILTHHTRKAAKRTVEEDPFQSFSGASSLRSFYSSGMLLLRPDEMAPERLLLFELRNGPEIRPKTLCKVEGRWQELEGYSPRLAMREHGERLDAERRRRHDTILRLIYSEACKGRVFTAKQFAEAFETKSGLGSERSIRERINVLATQGYIRFFKSAEAYGIRGASGTRLGYICVEEMFFKREDQPLLPSHYKCPRTGDILPVENPYTWQYAEEDSA